jgi:hypothetical protein
MGMIELKSFDLEVSGSEASGYTVQAIGPAGERDSAPLNLTSLVGLDSDLAALHAGPISRPILERGGSALFQALFPMKVMRIYVAAQARLGENEGLRLRLHLPPELIGLPWELLYYPPDFLCLDLSSPVVRFLALPDPPKPLAVEPPLRLLHLIAAPVDQPRLDVQGETDQIQRALAGLVDKGKVEILPGRPGRISTLQDQLRQGCHILHFSGHGGFSGEEGYLIFEDEQGYGQQVTPDLLAKYLKNPSIRLAVLNACESATAGTGDAFSSMAAALIQKAGLPAVIAYQQAMPDSSAIAFAAEFYAALADGYPVDAAVTEGRKAVLNELGEAWCERLDWATPVLYMQAPDGYIMAVKGQEQPAGSPGPLIQIGTIRDSQLDFFAPPAPEPSPPGPKKPIDRLPALLDELRDRVRDQAPPARRDEAMEKVTTLRGAATERRPNLALMQSILEWFEAEIPHLSPPVLNAILGVKPRLEALDDEMMWDFRQRFEDQ